MGGNRDGLIHSFIIAPLSAASHTDRSEHDGGNSEQKPEGWKTNDIKSYEFFSTVENLF